MRLQWQGKGDCFRTCLAILLNMDRMAVPDFDSDDNKTYLDKYNNWLSDKNMYLTLVEPKHPNFTIPHPVIAVGESAFIPGGLHSVIWKNGKVIFNPNHKSGKIGIVGYPFCFIIPMKINLR